MSSNSNFDHVVGRFKTIGLEDAPSLQDQEMEDANQMSIGELYHDHLAHARTDPYYMKKIKGKYPVASVGGKNFGLDNEVMVANVDSARKMPQGHFEASFGHSHPTATNARKSVHSVAKKKAAPRRKANGNAKHRGRSTVGGRGSTVAVTHGCRGIAANKIRQVGVGVANDKFDLEKLCASAQCHLLSDDANDFVAASTEQTKEYLREKESDLCQFFDAMSQDP